MVKGKKTTSFWKIARRILLGVGVICGIVVAFLIFAVFYGGDTRPILSVADEFKPDSSWKLTEERVEPPRIMCAGDIACPSVFRKWVRKQPISIDELQSIMRATGWRYFEKGKCEPSSCMLSANDSTGMSIYVYTDVNSDLTENELYLSIQRS